MGVQVIQVDITPFLFENWDTWLVTTLYFQRGIEPISIVSSKCFVPKTKLSALYASSYLIVITFPESSFIAEETNAGN